MTVKKVRTREEIYENIVSGRLNILSTAKIRTIVGEPQFRELARKYSETVKTYGANRVQYSPREVAAYKDFSEKKIPLHDFMNRLGIKSTTQAYNVIGKMATFMDV